MVFDEGMLDDLDKELAEMELAESKSSNDPDAETASARERQAQAGVDCFWPGELCAVHCLIRTFLLVLLGLRSNEPLYLGWELAFLQQFIPWRGGWCLQSFARCHRLLLPLQTTPKCTEALPRPQSGCIRRYVTS